MGQYELLQALLETTLIDEYRLFIFPVILGSASGCLGAARFRWPSTN